MLIVILMNEARKPENWQWMWQGETALETSEIDDDEPIDTRLKRSLDAETTSQPGVFVATKPGIGKNDDDSQEQLRHLAATISAESDDSGQPSVVEEASFLAETDLWLRLWTEHTFQQRELVLRALRSHRSGDSFELKDNDDWTDLLESLNRGVKNYCQESNSMLEEDDNGLNELQRTTWAGLLQQIQSTWSLDQRPALELLPSAQVLNDQHSTVLAHLQDVLDAVGLQLVKDDTVFRPTETAIWFRLIEKLEEQSTDELRDSSIGNVGFLELFKQPDLYRGKVVSIHGSARMAYHVAAPDNHLGIEGYYVFVIKPHRGPPEPVIVYSLFAPPGLTEIPDKNVDGRTLSLNEDIQVTGYFFKRWAYRSAVDTNLAPLVITHVPVMTAAKPEQPAKQKNISQRSLTIGLIIAFFVAFAVTTLAYQQSRRRAPSQPYRSKTSPDQFGQAMQQEEVLPGLQKRLDALGHESDPNSEAPEEPGT